MRTSLVTVPAGVPTPVLATQMDRLCTITESTVTVAGAANSPSGFKYALSADGFVQYYGVAAGGTLTIGDPSGIIGPYGAIIGNGPGVQLGVGPTPATKLCVVISTAGTTLQVVEQA